MGVILCLGNYFLELQTYGEATEDHLWLGLVLTIQILITGVFSYYQNSKSSRIIESFQQILPERAQVLRDDERKELLVTELVIGDIVLLETGDRVPADIRILECQGEMCPAVPHRAGEFFFRFSAEETSLSPCSIEDYRDFFTLYLILCRDEIVRKGSSFKRKMKIPDYALLSKNTKKNLIKLSDYITQQ